MDGPDSWLGGQLEEYQINRTNLHGVLCDETEVIRDTKMWREREARRYLQRMTIENSLRGKIMLKPTAEGFGHSHRASEHGKI